LGLLFWYFWLTIQNTANRHVSNAFDLLGVLFRFPWSALLLLRQLQIFAAAAARPHPTPPPFFGGRKVPKKSKSPVATGLAFGHVCVGVGVLEVAVQCKNYTVEI
jgi:hypothetical protein